MTDYIVTGASTLPQHVSATEKLTIETGASLTTTGLAVQWRLVSSLSGLAVVDNRGIIEVSDGDAIAASGTARVKQELFLYNESAGTIRARGDVVQSLSSLVGGSVQIANEGRLISDQGHVVNVALEALPYVPGTSIFYFSSYVGSLTRSAVGATILLTNLDPAKPVSGYPMISNIGGQILQIGTGANAAAAIDTRSFVAAATDAQVRISNWEPNGLIQAVDADAIRIGNNTYIANIAGTIRSGGSDSQAADAQNDGIDFGANGGTEIYNFDRGQIWGAGAGISGQQAAVITNNGLLFGRMRSGIEIDSPGTSITTIVNGTTGEIGSYGPQFAGDGVHVSGLVNLTNGGIIHPVLGTAERSFALAAAANGLEIGGGTVKNSGSITATVTAILVGTDSGGAARGALTLTNSGVISIDPSLYGIGNAILIRGNFADKIVNTGTIVGDVHLGGGNDSFTSTSGTLTGIVYGEDGDDTINVGSSGARVQGGEGKDTLTGRGSLYGGNGDDHLIGLAPAAYGNWLDGGDGNDLIETTGGHWVFGGTGYDTLSFDASAYTHAINFGSVPRQGL
jgi:hypothetical protein